MGATTTLRWSAARRTLVLVAVWAVLVEGRPGDLLIGLPLAIAIALYTLRLSPPGESRRRLRPAVLLALAPRVFWLSVVGGVDVARRALRTPPDLDPDTVRFPLDPPSAPVAVGLSVILTLMPGTLAAEVDDAVLTVHVLDRNQPMEAALRDLEDRLRRGLGEAERRP